MSFLLGQKVHPISHLNQNSWINYKIKRIKKSWLLNTFQLLYSTAAIWGSKLRLAAQHVPLPVISPLKPSVFCVCVCALTVKLLLTFFVLDSATLASDRSTSSKIRDCGKEEVLVKRKEGNPERRTERQMAQKRTLEWAFGQYFQRWIELKEEIWHF